MVVGCFCSSPVAAISTINRHLDVCSKAVDAFCVTVLKVLEHDFFQGATLCHCVILVLRYPYAALSLRYVISTLRHLHAASSLRYVITTLRHHYAYAVNVCLELCLHTA